MLHEPAKTISVKADKSNCKDYGQFVVMLLYYTSLLCLFPSRSLAESYPPLPPKAPTAQIPPDHFAVWLDFPHLVASSSILSPFANLNTTQSRSNTTKGAEISLVFIDFFG